MLNRLFKYASLLLAAVMLASCSGTTDEGDANGGSIVSKELIVDADKKFVQTFGGDYVTLSVTLGGEPVTEGVTFYDDKDNVIPVENFKFMTEEAGEHQIFAGYGTYFSEPVTVTAIALEIPETLADPQPTSTDFRHRVLLTQFTTTGCTWCPSMKNVLKAALTDDYMEKVVKVDCHSTSMKRDDPAFVDLKGFEEQCNALLPSVNFDMSPMTVPYPTGGMSGADMQGYIDSWYASKEDKVAGIAVNSKATESQIVAKVSVKAAETASYRVGLMLLEDNIVANKSQTQQGSGAADWMDTHNSCIRYMDSKYALGGGARYYGHSLGEIAKGEVEDYVFILDLESIWKQGMMKAQQNGCTWATTWDIDELHLAVFTTTVGTDGKSEFYYVSNVVDCPIDGETPFEYR